MSDASNPFNDPPRYFLYALGVDIDIDYQFVAIRSLLSQHRAADAEMEREIQTNSEWAGQTGHEHAIDEWVDSMHGSVYQDAAHSLSAVGMLAPLIESILYQAFRATEAKYGRHVSVAASRPVRQNDEDKAWDCHWLCNKNGKWRKDLLPGVRQLSAAIGLDPFLPASADKTLSALFGYRNKNFHNGLEWPVEERDVFVGRVVQERWDGWFRWATSDNKPWVIYMTPEFIDHCLTFAEELLDALGTFVFELARKHGDPDLGPPPEWMKQKP
jgi:hypothetical protein